MGGRVISDFVDDNVDVEVLLPDGNAFLATFFTIQNIIAIMHKDALTGESESGSYFWASDMVLVRNLTLETISTAISGLMREGYFHKAFRPKVVC